MLYAVPLFFAVLWTPYNDDLTTILRVALGGVAVRDHRRTRIIGLKVSGERPN